MCCCALVAVCAVRRLEATSSPSVAILLRVFNIHLPPETTLNGVYYRACIVARWALPDGPSTPHRFVNRHERCCSRCVAHGELVFGFEQCSLRIEHLQEVGEASFEPLLREIRGARARGNGLLENCEPLVRAIVGDYCALGLFDRAQDRRRILCF